MEGTKHEKAVIVVLAYIVGFTSGFIAFGLTQPDLQSIAPVESPMDTSISNEEFSITKTDEQAPITAVDLAPTLGSIEEVYTAPKYTQGVHVYYETGRLFLSVEGTVTLLSVERSRIPTNESGPLSNQGSHVSISHYALSPDNSFVYFCEQQSETDSCVSFIYDITSQTIQYVAEGNSKVVLTSAEAKSVRFNQNGLVIGARQSMDPTSPWKVSVR